MVLAEARKAGHRHWVWVHFFAVSSTGATRLFSFFRAHDLVPGLPLPSVTALALVRFLQFSRWLESFLELTDLALFDILQPPLLLLSPLDFFLLHPSLSHSSSLFALPWRSSSVPQEPLSLFSGSESFSNSCVSSLDTSHSLISRNAPQAAFFLHNSHSHACRVCRRPFGVLQTAWCIYSSSSELLANCHWADPPHPSQPPHSTTSPSPSPYRTDRPYSSTPSAQVSSLGLPTHQSCITLGVGLIV